MTEDSYVQTNALPCHKVYKIHLHQKTFYTTCPIPFITIEITRNTCAKISIIIMSQLHLGIKPISLE